MRKKQRFITQGAVIGFGVGALIDILMQWIEHSDRGEKLTWDSFDGSRTLTTGLVGGVLGAGVGYISYELGNSLDDKESFNSDEYIKNVLRTENLKANPDLLEKALFFRDKIKIWLLNNVAHKLASVPENTGSFIKRTANANSFDIDILLPYKRDSFQTLEEMYNWTYEKLYKEFGGKATVKRNTKAISLLFEKDGIEINFDIVPGREINNYKKDRKLNLYINPTAFWRRGSSFKIDTTIQRNITTNKPEARRVIRLVKSYNIRNSLSIPSVIIEQSVVEALSDCKYGIFYSDTENLLNSMEYLSEKLDQEVFTDLGNTNNNLNNKMPWDKKITAVNLIRADVEKIENCPNYLCEIFEI
jgi:hypothetical protein